MGFNNPAISVIKCVGFNPVMVSPALTALVLRNLIRSWEMLSVGFYCSQRSSFSWNFVGFFSPLKLMLGFGTKGGIPAWNHKGSTSSGLGKGFVGVGRGP